MSSPIAESMTAFGESFPPCFPLEFHPVFQVIDSVTEKQSTYTGHYTLRVLAGGTRLNNMSPFDESRNMQVL